MKRERIGFDLDSVICDIDAVIDKILKDKFNLYLDWDKDFACYDFDRNPNLTSYIAEYLSESVTSGNLFISPQPYEDVHEGLKLLRKEKFYIDIITSRYKDKENITVNWLKKHKIIYDDIYFSKSRNKKDLIFGLDIKAFVEDRFDILNMILEKCGPLPYGLIIRDHPWNRKFHNKNVDRVDTFLEACEIIIEYKNGGR
jgi:uncharacterized HAD superfamily protein